MNLAMSQSPLRASALAPVHGPILLVRYRAAHSPF
jgi:hypothetical protein